MTGSGEAGSRVFLSYTRALRHPVIIGKVAGWSLPWAMSATQLAAIAGTATGLLFTRALWAHLGGVGNLVFFTVVVGGVGWGVRHWRIEGRSPLRVAASIAAVVSSPARRYGVRNGRAAIPPRPVRSRHPGVFVLTSEGDR